MDLPVIMSAFNDELEKKIARGLPRLAKSHCSICPSGRDPRYHSHFSWLMPSAIGIIRLDFRMAVKTEMSAFIVIADGHLGRGRFS